MSRSQRTAQRKIGTDEYLSAADAQAGAGTGHSPAAAGLIEVIDVQLADITPVFDAEKPANWCGTPVPENPLVLDLEVIDFQLADITPVFGGGKPPNWCGTPVPEQEGAGAIEADEPYVCYFPGFIEPLEIAPKAIDFVKKLPTDVAYADVLQNPEDVLPQFFNYENNNTAAAPAAASFAAFDSGRVDMATVDDNSYLIS